MIAGYGVIVALTILGFNVWLEGRAPYGGGPLLLFQGTMVAVVAGLAGGVVAALIGRRRPLLHAAVVLVPLALDTGWVLFFGPRTAPIWFDVMASATLMLFTLAGGGLVRTRTTSE